MRINGAVREVERELQTARLRAVSTNRSMRVRFNCPVEGQFRLVEVTGSSTTDNAVNRCDQNVYGYPGPRDTDTATPAHDGPVRTLASRITLAGTDLQFAPDGTTRTVSGTGVLSTITTPVSITITRDSRTMTVTVNALGKIQLQ